MLLPMAEIHTNLLNALAQPAFSSFRHRLAEDLSYELIYSAFVAGLVVHRVALFVGARW